ncbi:hypothetical protein [Paenibacillus spongiae]|uniref:Uncharacterized protein n=1 Tax=Paenibacillus spongiae TaxID=2909671 RepID=A0ABY5SFE9_9BACL|nr:hypothetical protein [Paenibacillus spongiae]UVI31230.1 hypothetical protein L1F29_05135 [Paenibacillus spongiae]
MRKKADDYLDTEAMRLGFIGMLADLNVQLVGGDHSPAIRAVLMDRKQHIEKRLEDLK